MSKAIELSFTYDKEHFVDFTKKVYDYEMRHSSKRYIGWLFIALAQFGIVAALKHNAYGLLYISTFLLLYWYVLRWQLRKILALRVFEKFPNKNQQLFIKIDQDSFKINDQNISFTEITRYWQLQDGVVLYYHNKALFFPKSAFKSIEDYDAFLDILKSFDKYANHS